MEDLAPLALDLNCQTQYRRCLKEGIQCCPRTEELLHLKRTDPPCGMSPSSHHCHIAKNQDDLLCHGMTSLPLLCPPLAASDPIHLHSASSTSAPLQLQCILVQLVQLHHGHSWTNCRSIPDPFGPGSHTKGHHLYTLSTFVLFA